LKVAILIAPKFDDATTYSYDWSREIKVGLEQKGYTVIDISGRRVSRAEVEKALKENPGVIYIHYDHGSEDAHWGSETEAVVDLDNVSLLGQREVYCMNCLSAKKLGVEAYKNGAVAYWGYVEVFTFTTEALDEFRDFANSGLKFRLEGKSWEECLQLAKELAKELCQKLIEAGKYISSVILQQDADALRCYTQNNPPTSDCTFRKTAIKLLGPELGWKISRKHALSIMFLGAGIGVYLHDRVAEWVTLGCRLHGLDVGAALLVLAWFVLSFEVVKWLKHG
jgi:hypothetical protein